MRLAITGGHLIDPAANIDAPTDLYIVDDRVAALGRAPDGFVADRTIDANGRLVTPGLVDLQARLREPGQTHKGTIASEGLAAARGGVTTVCCPPDTNPVIDNAAVAEQIRHRAEDANVVRVLPFGALTQGLAGEQLAEMYALKAAGCVAMSNARRTIKNTLVARRALEYAATLDLTVMLCPEDPWLGASGCVHEGRMSSRLGLPGVPECAEIIAVSRELVLIERTGVRAHFGQLSSSRAVDLIAEAQSRGLPVTADVSAHQLFLTEVDVGVFDAMCHVRPPLRTLRDRDGLRAALSDGVITAICSDHQPHDRDAKLAPFCSTEPGISALETLLPLTLRLADEGVLSRRDAIAAVTSHPAKILGNDDKYGTLTPGAKADVCIFDPDHLWTVTEESLASRGKNTPFLGWEMKGRVVCTVLAGRIVYEG